MPVIIYMGDSNILDKKNLARKQDLKLNCKNELDN